MNIVSADDLVLGSTRTSAKALLININWLYTPNKYDTHIPQKLRTENRLVFS